MARSLQKGPYIDSRLQKKLAKVKPGDKTVINTYARNSMISPEMVGFTIGIHNGRTFISVSITEEMVGHRLGEFALTRKFIRHGGKMQRELEAKVVEGEKAALEANKNK